MATNINTEYVGFVSCTLKEYSEIQAGNYIDNNVLYYITDLGKLYKGTKRIDTDVVVYSSQEETPKVQANTFYLDTYTGSFSYCNAENSSLIKIITKNDVSNISYNLYGANTIVTKKPNTNSTVNLYKTQLVGKNKVGETISDYSNTIYTTDTTYDNADSFSSGLMSSADKIKLDKIEIDTEISTQNKESEKLATIKAVYDYIETICVNYDAKIKVLSDMIEQLMIDNASSKETLEEEL